MAGLAASAELITILAAGVALGGVLLTALRGIADRLGKIEERLGGVEPRVARLEGLLEGAWRDYARWPANAGGFPVPWFESAVL